MIELREILNLIRAVFSLDSSEIYDTFNDGLLFRIFY